MAKFDPSNPEHVKAAEFMAAVEAEEIAKDLAALEGSRSGVDGAPMPYEEFLQLHNLPDGRPEKL